MAQLDYASTIATKIAIRQEERNQSFIAYQQIELQLNELRTRIVALDGALKELRELESAANVESSA